MKTLILLAMLFLTACGHELTDSVPHNLSACPGFTPDTCCLPGSAVSCEALEAK